jgi:hypothetical protein
MEQVIRERLPMVLDMLTTPVTSGAPVVALPEPASGGGEESEDEEPEKPKRGRKRKADEVAEWNLPDLFVGDRFSVKRANQKPGVDYPIRSIAKVLHDRITDTDGESVTLDGFSQFYELVPAAAPTAQEKPESEPVAESQPEPVNLPPFTWAFPPGTVLVQTASGRVSIVGPETDYSAGRVELLKEDGTRQEITTPFMIKQFYQAVPPEPEESADTGLDS